MIYYKIVTSSLRSCMNSEHFVQYKVGEYVTPVLPNSKLFVFETRKNILKFRHVYYSMLIGHKIYTCEATNTQKASSICWGSCEYRNYWRFYNAHGPMPQSIIGKAPPGTLVADSVKLVKQYV